MVRIVVAIGGRSWGGGLEGGELSQARSFTLEADRGMVTHHSLREESHALPKRSKKKSAASPRMVTKSVNRVALRSMELPLQSAPMATSSRVVHADLSEHREKIEPLSDSHSQTPMDVVADDTSDGTEIDFTQVPTILDKQFERLDLDSALHPTIINVGSMWTRKRVSVYSLHVISRALGTLLVCARNCVTVASAGSIGTARHVTACQLHHFSVSDCVRGLCDVID
eukprot:m.323553 g.323553  ORF g.323553 m.323553 type:complete len:226 (-) comp20359_c5_seq1:1024-1701(-)